MDYSYYEDPSAAEAVEDDMNEWEPLANGGIPEEEEDTDGEEYNENVQQVLQAVDDLLQAEGTDTEDEASTTSNGSTTSSKEETTAKQEQQQQQPSSAETKKTKKESPLKLRRRLKAARYKLQQALVHPVKHRAVSKTRKIVTGSTQTRVRDFLGLPHIVRILDKYTFTGGIMGMLVTEWVVLDFPAQFRYYFCAIMLPLLLLRVVLFQRTKQQYFLLDYCYWVNSLGFGLALLPSSVIEEWFTPEWLDVLWQIFFVSANGPLFFAMVAWNNSLVFHSVDKVTSTYVHLFPALLSMTERWRSDQVLNAADDLSWKRHLGYPMLFYGTWQFVYLIQTEWLFRDTLDADPELSTSLRYLSSAEKMAVNKKTLQLCRSVGIMGPKETFHPPTTKVKCIFVILQAFMTLITFSPVKLFYDYQWVHYFVVLAILTFSVYNGARYYIQVFSKIYEKRYKQHPDEEEEEYVDTSAVMTEHVNNNNKNKKA